MLQLPRDRSAVARVCRSAPAQNQGGAGPGRAPAEVGGELDILHLAAAALAIVEGVNAAAALADRAIIVDVVAQLAHVLDHHADAVGVALAQMAAAGVVRPPAAEMDDAVAAVGAAFAGLTEAVGLELQERCEGEGVVRAGDVDVLGSDPGVAPQDLAR